MHDVISKVLSEYELPGSDQAPQTLTLSRKENADAELIAAAYKNSYKTFQGHNE